MRENIVIKHSDENLQYIVIDLGYKQISVADLLDEYGKMLKAVYLIERTESFASELEKFANMLKDIRSNYENN